MKVEVSKTQNLEIYDPIRVSPKQVVLLWDPQVEYSYQQNLEATGGSGKYQWSCDPEDVVGVSNFGTISAMKEGMAVVTAADKRNTAHFDNAEVSSNTSLLPRGSGGTRACTRLSLGLLSAWVQS